MAEKITPRDVTPLEPVQAKARLGRLSVSSRASHLLTGAIATALTGAVVLSETVGLAHSARQFVGGATTRPAPQQAGAGLQTPATAQDATVPTNVPLALVPAQIASNLPTSGATTAKPTHQALVDNLPHDAPSAKRVEPMVAPVRRVLPKTAAPVPPVPVPAAPSVAAAPAATAPAPAIATFAPAASTVALAASAAPVAVAPVAAGNVKAVAGTKQAAKTAAGGREVLPKPMGLAAPKSSPAPVAAKQSVPKVISCLAGETYQPKTKTCAKALAAKKPAAKTAEKAKRPRT